MPVSLSEKYHSHLLQYLLSVLICDFFDRKIIGSGSGAARVHGIPQRQFKKPCDHADEMTRVTQGNGECFIIHGWRKRIRHVTGIKMS